MSISAFVAYLFIALGILLAALTATYSARYDDAMDELDELKAELDESRGREQALQNHVNVLLSRLGYTERPRGFGHVNLAAPALDLNTPFLNDHFPAAGSLGDPNWVRSEVETWLATNPPTSED